MQLSTTLSSIIFSSALLLSATVIANPPDNEPGKGHHQTDNPHHSSKPSSDSMGHHDKMSKMSHHKSKGGKKGGHGTFTPHWAKTLTDQQKRLVDRMHVDVTKQQSVLKAKIALKKAELENLMVTAPYNKTAAHALIDEIAKIKAQKLKVRYDHVAEMRSALTEDQRLSYDMDRFKDKKHGEK